MASKLDGEFRLRLFCAARWHTAELFFAKEDAIDIIVFKYYSLSILFFICIYLMFLDFH